MSPLGCGSSGLCLSGLCLSGLSPSGLCLSGLCPSTKSGAQVCFIHPTDTPGEAREETQGGDYKDLPHAGFWSEGGGEERLNTEEPVPQEQSLGGGALWQSHVYNLQPGS